MSTSSLVLALDLGNTSGSCAVCRGGSVDVIPNEQGSRMTPAVISFTEVETLLGEPARGQIARNAANTIVDGLRLLGRNFDDADFQEEMSKWRFRVSRGNDGAAPQVDVSVKGEAKSFAPPRLLSHLFAQLRGDAEANTGENVKEAVLVVPAHFSEVQRAALKESAQIGGVRVKMLLSSPLCAALLYAHTAASPEPPPTLEVVVAAAPRVQQLLVVDVGGSGIEAAVVERTISATAKGAEGGGGGEAGGPGQSVEELSVRSSLHTRGACANSVDKSLQQHVLKEIRRRQRVDLTENSRACQRLLATCQAAKQSLTAAAQAQVTVEADGVDYFSTVSRATLEELTAPVATTASTLAAQAITAAGLDSPSQIEALLLCGGGCRMSRVQAALTGLCPNATIHFGGISEEVPCRGAAIAGAMLKAVPLSDLPNGGGGGNGGGEVSSLLVTRPRLPRALGIRTADGTVLTMVEAYAAIPLTRTLKFGCTSSTATTTQLLSLVELPPPSAAVDVSDAAPASAPAADEAMRAVASLAVREVPEGAEALHVVLKVEADGSLELHCDAVGESGTRLASVKS